MRIVVIGAGAVGRHLCEQLSLEDHEVVLVDRRPDRLRRLGTDLNILTVEGNGASAACLQEAEVHKADLFIAVTDIDEVNLVACIMAGALGVRRRVARVRNEEYLSGDSPLNEHSLGIDLLINPDQAMADEIVRMSSVSEAFEAVDFAHGEVVLLGYAVREESPVAGMSLADLKGLVGLYDFLVVAMVREGVTLIPRGDDVIQPGDRIYLVIKRRDLPALEELLNVRRRAVRKVFIIGGGRVGYRVARALERQKIDVRLVEKDPARCELLAEKLKDTIVLNFDGLEAHELIAEGIDQADLVVTVTHGDTTNILASLLAKHHGAKKCITRITRPDFIPLLGKLGIDVALSARLVAADMILRFVRRGAILSVASLVGSEAEVVELVLTERWSHLGRPLREISFPRGANIGAVVRNGEVIIPSGETVFQPLDRLIVFTLKKAVPEVEAFLSS
ncbi:Trk system potassium transporter TrkA [Dissulfurirhabdus thermomarina]|uniref:Trk system potassium uptake protein TrkA n=1 Tax=Dissulfurirhabdus thermomarina TaxID=1765737 RepID=A0A6N9TKB9_DISTH|nr:Trk system potassium transporter TrkA [Dissulfurirhabdus thermomarina]NDY41712.1 Trk system potassium transporter TrkA [Dissulfurirhabdus thermomarina]NMX23198.1 Trk system potassium transporter TrkA [Dissulfurirhabdus thermomarina]